MSPDEYEEFIRDQTEMRLALFYQRRPAEFAARGWLDNRIHTWLEGMVRGENRTLLIGGHTGTGKSWSLWKSVETLLHNGWRGRWEIINADTFRQVTTPPVDEERLDRIRRCEFLAFDDLGAMRVSEWAAENLYSVVDYRWSHQLPLVITSNESDIDALVGPRIASRLCQDLSTIVLDGPDRRVS